MVDSRLTHLNSSHKYLYYPRAPSKVMSAHTCNDIVIHFSFTKCWIILLNLENVWKLLLKKKKHFYLYSPSLIQKHLKILFFWKYSPPPAHVPVVVEVILMHLNLARNIYITHGLKLCKFWKPLVLGFWKLPPFTKHSSFNVVILSMIFW